jgi:hypothetical protein
LASFSLTALANPNRNCSSRWAGAPTPPHTPRPCISPAKKPAFVHGTVIDVDGARTSVAVIAGA